MLSTKEKHCVEIETNLTWLKVAVKKSIDKIKGESITCQEFEFDNMTEQLQTEYLDMCTGVKADICQGRQVDESSVVSTMY